MGGMSVLYKALDTQENGKHVAVKIYSAKPIEDEVLHESFKRERMALRELKHPNIVAISDEGYSEDQKSYFTVLEWLEKPYAEHLKQVGRIDWATFYKHIGRPVLEAISFAHNRSYVHRDIKTDNIVLASDGTPKVIDFGTSKLKRYIAYGRTLREFSSEPFSPPERDDGSNTYSRDTYAYCVTALDSLMGGGLSTREDVLQALTSASFNSSVREVFARALTEDQDDRYGNADALLADLDATERTRLSLNAKRPDCYIQLTAKVVSVLGEHFGVSTQEAVEKLVAEDINSACGIRPFKPSTARAEQEAESQYQLFGAELSYHVKVDSFARDRLVVLSVKAQSPFLLEKLRDRSCPSPVRFRFGIPLGQNAARTALAELDLTVQTFTSEQEDAEQHVGSDRLFDIWKHMLEVKYEHDIQQQDPIKYTSFDVDGTRIHLKCETPIAVEHQGQQRSIRIYDGAILTGEITDVDFTRNELTFVCTNAQPDSRKIPAEGQIVVDINSNKVSLDRQRNALEAVRAGAKETVRADLGTLIAQPETIRDIKAEAEIKLFQSLDPDKVTAVQKAAGLSDFLLIDGPPGTGKTTVIAEIVLQELSRNPRARILLTSQTNIALDNAIERIEEVSSEASLDISITRLGRIDDDRIGIEVRKYLLPERMDAWKAQALHRSDGFLETWASRRGIDRKHVEVGMLVEQALQLKRQLSGVDQLESFLKGYVDREPVEREQFEVGGEDVPVDLDVEDAVKLAKRDLARVRDDRVSIRRQLENVRTELSRFGQFEADLADEDEASLQEFLSLYQLDGAGISEFRKMLSLSAEWKLRFGVGADFQTALMASTNLVAGTCIGVVGYRGAHEVAYDLCILDEASKATATEALVPLSRSRRWILVGDLQQLPPFQDEALRNRELLERFDLSPDDLGVTLFSHLLRSAPTEAKARLSSQRRMVRAIGDLISACFYDRTIETKTDRVDPELIAYLGRPVLWISTSRMSKRSQEPVRGSIQNAAEGDQVLRWLKKLDTFAGEHDKTYSVCVLTPYSGQIAALQRRIVPEQARLSHLKIEVKTVDAYQGKEADIAILSLVRSNTSNTLGFLKEHERLNVALSRGRLALLIIGDKDFLKRAKEPNPFKRVIDYIESTPNDCLCVEARQ
jgi:hypothetical protein